MAASARSTPSITSRNSSAGPGSASIRASPSRRAPPPPARHITPQSETAGQALLRDMNREHQERLPGDSQLEARIASYELAARLQSHAPEALDLGRETEATRRAYGIGQPATESFA